MINFIFNPLQLNDFHKKIIFFINQILHFILTSALIILLTRTLAKSEYGRYSYYLLFFTLAGQVAGNFYYIGYLRRASLLMKNEVALFYKLYKYFTIKFLKVYLLLSFIILIYLIKVKGYDTLIFLLLLFFLLRSFSRFNNQVLNNLEYQVNYSIIESLILLVQFITLLIFKFNNILNVVYVFIIFQVIQCIIHYIFIFKILNHKKHLNSELKNIEEEKLKIIKFSKPFILGNIIMFIAFQGDKILIEEFFTFQEVGVYNANFQFAWVPLTLIISSVSTYITPHWYNLINEKKFTQLKNNVYVILKYYIFSIIFSLTIFLIAGEYLINLILSSFSDGLVFLILFIASSFYSCSMFFETYFMALNIPNTYIKYRNIVFIFYFPLSYVLYWTFGVNAIGIGILFTTFIYLLVVIILYIKSSHTYRDFKIQEISGTINKV